MKAILILATGALIMGPVSVAQANPTPWEIADSVGKYDTSGCYAPNMYEGGCLFFRPMQNDAVSYEVLGCDDSRPTRGLARTTHRRGHKVRHHRTHGRRLARMTQLTTTQCTVREYQVILTEDNTPTPCSNLVPWLDVIVSTDGTSRWAITPPTPKAPCLPNNYDPRVD